MVFQITLILVTALLLPLNVLSLPVAPIEVKSKKDMNVSIVVDSVIASVGGYDNLHSVKSFSYNASTIYRSQTLTQNYNLYHSDQSIAAAGQQLMAFEISSTDLLERIDRSYQYNDYWIWAFPDLKPFVNFSLVVQDGDDGFACFNHGQNTFYANDLTQPFGYADSYLTDYLIHQAHQFAIPWLLQTFTTQLSKLSLGTVVESTSGESWISLEHSDLGLILLVNSTSHLPYMVRSLEDHAIFGPSTNDLLLSDFRKVQLSPEDSRKTLRLPHRFQSVYNSEDVLEDFIIDDLILNPSFSQGYFDPLPEGESQNPRSKPSTDPEYPRSEVHEFFETGLWGGPFTQEYNDTRDVVVEYPIPGLERIRSVHVGYADYVQLVVEFDQGVLVTDAPAHRSKIVIEWIRKTLNKNVTHIVPSHHHHDHASGVGDYVAAGAKLVVPESAREFYKNINEGKVEFVTYTESEPFVLKDGHVQFRSMWRNEAPHARDWTYGIATSACPTASDRSIAVFVADVVSPGTNALRWDSGYARQWLLDAAEDGLPKSATIIGAHGSTLGGNSTTDSLENVAQAIGFAYPELTVGDWKAGGPLC